MGWLGLVAMATVGRQSKEGDAGIHGVQSPPTLCRGGWPRSRDRQGMGAGQTAAAGASSFSWDTHGHNPFK